MYASYVAIFAVPAQLVVLAWRPRAWRRVASARSRCAPCAGSRWRCSRSSRGSDQLFWIARPNLTSREAGRAGADVGRLRAELPPDRGRRGRWRSRRWRCCCSPPRGSPADRAGVDRWRCPGWSSRSALMWLESLVGQPIFTPAQPARVAARGGAAARLGDHAAAGFRRWLAWLAVGVLIALRAVRAGTELRHLARELARRHRVLGRCRAARRLHRVLSARCADAVRVLHRDGRCAPHVEQYETPTVPTGCRARVAGREPPGAADRDRRVPRALRPLRRAARGARATVSASRHAGRSATPA